MRFFGFEITRRKAATPTQPTSWLGGWWPVIREPFAGAWQRNMEIRAENVLAYSAVYACVTLIASDIAKLRVKLVQQDGDGIWSEAASPSFSPVLRKPNGYQNRIKFYANWATSKLIHGNAYILKERDERNVVIGLHVLDPVRTVVRVAPDGAIYYQVAKDALSGVAQDSMLIPASEIIHDVMNPLYHPLCGVSPITACGLAAVQGLAIQRNSANFFTNGSLPGGVLMSPHEIGDPDLEKLKKEINERYSGENRGKTMVLAGGLEYKPIAMSATDAQLIEQLGWTAKDVCSAFHVPPYMIGVGDPPSYNNIEALNQQYYSQALQIHIESIELCLDEGLALTEVPGKTYGSEFDLDDLLRMDTATKVKVATDGIKGGLFKPDEGRKKFDLRPVPGGDQVYLQQQNFSLEALAKRDAKDDPFASAAKSVTPPAAANDDDDQDEDSERAAANAQLAAWALKSHLDRLAA